ncbi:hypothetical protein DMJ13_23100 [halophilic archaeon]|nr:hypothetical protein DMJ13_23100 [halophilic archaeon]
MFDDLDKDMTEEILNEPEPTVNHETTEVIFLDQNKWGNLHDGRHNPDSEYADTYDVVQQSVNDEATIYPFGLTRQIETNEHSDLTFRRQLYELMLDLSHNICFKNFFLVTKAERIAYLKSCIPGHTKPDITDNVFDRGIVAPLGMPRVTELSNEDNQKLQRFLQSERITRMLIQDDDYLAQAAGFQQQTDDMDLQKRESARQRSQELADTDEERWEILLARDLVQYLIPLLSRYAQQVDLTTQPQIHDSLQKHDFDIEEFLTHFPAYYSQLVLSHGRDFHWDREIEANDLEDIMSLAVAIPYSDVVVTEQFFAGVAYKHGLPDRYNTRILTDLHDLEKYLTDT